MLHKKASVSSSSIVQSSSFSTLCVLSLFSFTIFIIYRYVKSLEKEVKQLSGKFDTLSMTVLSNVDTSKDLNVDVPLSADKGPSLMEQDCFYNDDEDVTVKSEEVIELMADLHEDEPEYQIPSSNGECVKASETSNDDDDDVQLIVKEVLDEESLKKKTNEELKKLLKAKDKSVKGSKSELINRLLEQNEVLE